MPLTVHIGLPKTGTTFLQKTLAGARADLAAQGVDYPDSGYYNHQIALYEPLGRHLPWTARPGLPERWAALHAALREDGERHGLISAEALSALDDQGVRLLADLVAARPLAAVLVTARPLEWLLPSHWQQNLKQGATASLPAFAESTLRLIEERQHPASMYSPGLALQRWRAVFPQVPMAVLHMGPDFLANLDAFVAGCGLPASVDLRPHVPPPSEQNLSFSVDECRRLMLLNERIAAGRATERDRRKAMAIFFRQRDAGTSYEKPRLPEELLQRARALDAVSDALCRDLGCQVVRPGRMATAEP